MGKIVLLLMLPSLLIDSITGWMSLNASLTISLSQIYRSGMFVVMFAWLACFWFRGIAFLISLLAILMIFMAWHSFSATNFSSVAEDLRFNLSLFAHFIYYLFLVGYIRCLRSNMLELLRLEKAVYRIVWFSFSVIAINIILGSFGFGYSTLASFVQEGVSSGFKGFFFAGNDLSSVFLIVSGAILIRIWSCRKLVSYLLLAIVMLVLAIMLQTRAVILGTLILIIFIPISMTGIIFRWRFNLKPLIPLFSGLAFSLAALSWLISSDSAIFRRTMYVHEKRDFLAAVTTGRSDFFFAAMDAWEKYYSQIDWLLGLGWIGFIEAMTKTMGYPKRVEIDYVDILMTNGLFGLVLVLIIWAWYLRSSFILRNKTEIAGGVLFVNILLLILAGTSGHVLFSSMNGMFVAMLNILPFILNNQIDIKTGRMRYVP